jgi:hypothetical protein
MNTVKWNTFVDSDVDSFNIYRSITGLSITFPNSLQTGDVFQFAATSPTVQKVTIGATDINSVAAAINAQAKGLTATVSQSGLVLFIRCTAKERARLKLYPCTFLTHLSIPVSIIVPRSNFVLLANVAFVPAPSAYSYSDLDGNPLDWYHITSVKSSIETIPSIDQKPIITPESVCTVEGRVIDVQNNPIVGAEVRASPIGGVETSDNSGLVTPGIVAYTDDYGRWSMPLIQGKRLLFEIASIGYSQVCVVPSQSFCLFQNLEPVDSYYFSPSGDFTGGFDVGVDEDIIE